MRSLTCLERSHVDSYAVQRNGRVGSLHWINEPLNLVATLLPSSWLPGWLATNSAFWASARRCLSHRLADAPLTRDIFSYLLENSHRSPFSPGQLKQAAGLVLAAGVDVVRLALAWNSLTDRPPPPSR